MIGIYKITNIINNKIYVGQAGKGLNTIEGRIKSHKYDLKNNKHGNKHLQSSYNKYTLLYGEYCFTFEIIEECKKDELDDKETYWINFYKSYDRKYGYNKDFGGSKGIPTKETKQKMSDSAKGKILSDITKQKLSEANTGEKHPNFGKHLSNITKLKISESNMHKHYRLHSKETKKKMSESHKGISTWNKGFTKENNEILKEIGEKISVTLSGKSTWNKGLTKENNEIVKQMSKKN